MNRGNSFAEQFRKQGYLVIPEAVPDQSLDHVRMAAAAIVDAFDPEAHQSIFSTSDNERGRDGYFMDSAEAVHCFLEEGAVDQDGRLNRPKSRAINKIGHALHDLVPEFTELCRRPVFAQLLRDLGYEEAVLWQSMYIYKQPHIGGVVHWHQDASYLATEPAGVIGFWLALEDADRDNSCLWVQPGGHRSPLREIYEVDPKTRRGKTRILDGTPWPSEQESLAVEVPAGSVVIFSDHMPHYSSLNHSDKSRQAFTMHFAPVQARWSKKNWLQRKRLDPFIV